MTLFGYRNQQLLCEDVPLTAIAAAVETPTYIYSQHILEERARAYTAEPAGHAHYALKANSNIHLLRRLAQLGLGADLTSGGELFLAQRAGFAPQQMIFSGVGKTAAEIRAALAADIRALHAESAAEVDLIEQIAADMGRVAPLGVRINPDIAAETHPYISTGLKEHKFGVPAEVGLELLARAQRSPHLHPVGLAAHIGSQIRALDPFRQTAERLVRWAAQLKARGVSLDYLDVGGGLGLDYEEGAHGGIADWVAVVAAPIKRAGYELVMEPGRSLVGPVGVLLTRVIRTKRQGAKQFAIVDAAMNDLLRPTLYGAHHAIWPVAPGDGAEKSLWEVVGPICESGDFLARARPLAAVQAGDLLAVMDAGAYGFAMSSQYNGRPRAAEVLVTGETWRVIRQRQGYEQLLDGC